MANSYLSRTPSGAGNRKTYTISAWIKRSKLGSRQSILNNTDGSGQQGLYFDFYSDDSLAFLDYGNGAYETPRFETTRLFRDSSAWYHIVVAVDTTQATESNRFKLYVNGTQETAFDIANYPTQNADTRWNTTSAFEIGSYNGTGNYFEGYFSHFAFVDGQALAPTVFGETNSTSGIWKFKSPSGVTWGTNGFHLKFENSGAMGTDSSGNSNTFTVQGNLKQSLDTPSNVHATMNPLVKSGNAFTNGNLTITSNSGTSYQNSVSTLAVTKGKWYAECKLSNVSSVYPGVGIIDVSEKGANDGDNKGYFGSSDNPKGIQLYSGGFYSTGNNNNVSLTSNSTNDIIGIALDLDSATKNIKMYRNGTLITGTSVTPPDPDGGYAFGVTMNESAGSGAAAQWNFGNGFFGTTAITSAGSNGNGSLFEYDVPSGYYALNTKNINTYG